MTNDYTPPRRRMVEAIGEPKLIDTSADERLGRIFSSRTVKIYPPSPISMEWKTRSKGSSAISDMPRKVSKSASRYSISSRPVGGGRVVSRRTPEEADGAFSDLHAGDRRTGEPGFQITAGPLPAGADVDLLENKYGIARRRLTGLISPGPPSGSTRSAATSRASASSS